MAELLEGVQYGLSSQGNNSDKSLIFVKLTDSAFRAIDSFLKNQNKLTRSPTIQFLGNEGTLTFPSCESNHGVAAFKFSLSSSADIEGPQGSFECIKQTSSTSLESLGTLPSKMRIHAKDDVYEATRSRMAKVEENQKKNCTREIKPGGPGIGKKVKVRAITGRAVPATVPPPRRDKELPVLGNHPPPKQFPSSVKPSLNGYLPAHQNIVNGITPSNSIHTKPQGNNLIQRTSNPDIMRRPLRERLVHLLAVRPYKKPELYDRIKKEGLSERDKKHVGDILKQIASMRQNTFHLIHHIWNDVQEDWPFYSEQEKQMLKRRKPQNLTPPGSSDGSSGSGQSPTSTHPGSPPPPVSSGLKRPGYYEGSDGLPTKKPRISHYRKPDTQPAPRTGSGGGTGIALASHLDVMRRVGAPDCEDEDSRERRPFSERDIPAERRSFGERVDIAVERRPFGERDCNPSERRPFGERDSTPTERRPYGDRETTPSERRQFNDRDIAASERRPFVDRESTPSERRPYGERDITSNDRRLHVTERNGVYSDRRLPAVDRDSAVLDRRHGTSDRDNGVGAERDKRVFAMESVGSSSTGSVLFGKDTSSSLTRGDPASSSQASSSYQSPNTSSPGRSSYGNSAIGNVGNKLSREETPWSRSDGGRASSPSVNGRHHDGRNVRWNGSNSASNANVTALNNSGNNSTITAITDSNNLHSGSHNSSSTRIQSSSSAVPAIVAVDSDFSPSNHQENPDQHPAENHEDLQVTQSFADYLTNYTTIQNSEQRSKYKADFNADYAEYRRLHAEVEKVSQRFAHLERSLKQQVKNSPGWKSIQKQIVREYEENKRDQRHQEVKKRFQYLHEKLSHIKRLVLEYDSAQNGTYY